MYRYTISLFDEIVKSVFGSINRNRLPHPLKKILMNFLPSVLAMFYISVLIGWPVRWLIRLMILAIMVILNRNFMVIARILRVMYREMS